MAELNVIALTKELVALESETQHTNRAVADHLDGLLRGIGFVVERIAYDDKGVEKVNLVARLGEGSGGLGLFGHSDTVPGGDGWEPYQPQERDGRLYGRGSCDMKGAVAAMLAAASRIRPADLRHPLWIAVTSDEELGHTGARTIVAESQLLAARNDAVTARQQLAMLLGRSDTTLVTLPASLPSDSAVRAFAAEATVTVGGAGALRDGRIGRNPPDPAAAGCLMGAA